MRQILKPDYNLKLIIHAYCVKTIRRRDDFSNRILRVGRWLGV